MKAEFADYVELRGAMNLCLHHYHKVSRHPSSTMHISISLLYLNLQHQFPYTDP